MKLFVIFLLVLYCLQPFKLFVNGIVFRLIMTSVSFVEFQCVLCFLFDSKKSRLDFETWTPIVWLESAFLTWVWPFRRWYCGVFGINIKHITKTIGIMALMHGMILYSTVAPRTYPINVPTFRKNSDELPSRPRILNKDFFIQNVFHWKISQITYSSFAISDTNKIVVLCTPPPVNPAMNLAIRMW